MTFPCDPAQSPTEVAAARAALPTLVGAPLAALCFVESKFCYLLDPDGGFRIQAADGRVLAAKQGFAGDIDDATEDEEDVQAVLQMASLTSTVALGERAGRRVRQG